MVKSSELLIKTIKFFLHSKNISQVELSRRIGAKPQTVNRWMLGLASPGSDQIIGISKALGVEPYELLIDPDKPLDRAAEIESLKKTIKSQGDRLKLLESEIQRLTDDLRKPSEDAEVKFIDPLFQDLVDTALGIHPSYIDLAILSLEGLARKDPRQPSVNNEVIEKPEDQVDPIVTTPIKGRRS